MPAKYCIYNAVWGRPYLEPFLQISLPSFLAAGNIPYIASRADTTYVLYTEEQDVPFIKAAPSFQRLESLVSVKIIPISEACGSEAKDLNKYYRVASCTNHCIRNFVDSDTGLVIAVPDCVFSDGSLAASHERLSQGKRMIACTGLSVVKHSFISELPQHSVRTEDSLTIAPRELAYLGVKHLHPMFQVQEWNSECGTTWPSVLNWKVPNEGLIAHTLHYHPLVIQPYMKGITSWGTMDALYVLRACPRFEDIHFVTDSDELCGFSFTDEAYTLTHSGTPLTPELVDVWTRSNAHVHQRMSVTKSVRYHWGPLSPAWLKIEKEAEAIVEKLECAKPSEIRISIQERPEVSVGIMPGVSNTELQEMLVALEGNIRPPREVVILSDREAPSLSKHSSTIFKVRHVPVDATLTRGQLVRSMVPLFSHECCAFLQKGFTPTSQWLEAASSALARHPKAQLCIGNVATLDKTGQPEIFGGFIAHSEADLAPGEFLQLIRRYGLFHLFAHAQPSVYRTSILHKIFTHDLHLQQGTFSFLTQLLGLVNHSVYINEMCLIAKEGIAEQDPQQLRQDVEVQKSFVKTLAPPVANILDRSLNPAVGPMLETMLALSLNRSTFFEGMLPLDALSRVSVADMVRYVVTPKQPVEIR